MKERILKTNVHRALIALVILAAYSFGDGTALGQDEPRRTPIDLKDPPNIKTTYQYDPTTGNYLEIITVGGKPLGSPRVITPMEYSKAKERQDRNVYYRKKSNADNYIKGGGLIPKIAVTPEIFDKVFGGGVIDIRPTGSAEVTFGGNFNKVENPNFPVRQQRNGQFDFGMKMQLNVTGQIGDRMKLNWNYDTEATFEFENQMKLNWAGEEDDILKNIELGNVSLPLNGSLIQGGRNLFGAKTQLQFGKLKVAVIATQDKGETKETQVTGGAQITNYNIQAHNYDVNRHYFLSQYFANNYNQALSRLPVIASNVQISYIEVWITNRNNSVGNTRNVMGYMDLGENADNTYRDFLVGPANAYPDNYATSLYRDIIDRSTEFCNPIDGRLQLGTDYECLSNARKLNENEFSYHPTLGYLSLNQSLNNDELLMVAYTYTINGENHQVGDLTVNNSISTGDNSHLNLKLLKNSTIKTNLPTWNLMMKNIYSLNTYNLQQEDFTMNVVYADDPSGADLNYLPVDASETRIKEKQLITVLNLDKINKQQEAKPDGVFDLINGVTIDATKGRIIFPVREPFGAFLREQFIDKTKADYYVYDSLYQTTKWNAEQDLKHNKFFLRGTFKGSSSDKIKLQCYNISKGSVRVTANGNMLNEGSDYTVDYTMGNVTIVNQGILNSGAAIKATCESNSLINIQQKSLIGTRLDYKHSDKLLLGGTYMYMNERPLTNKVNIGEEPLRNSIWGLDGSYNTESRFLTRMVDKLPFIETKEKSTISITGEFAHLIPHKAKTQGDKGTSYLDDFEGAETPYDLKYVRSWYMASTPQGQPDLFPETTTSFKADSAYNSKRAKLAWYNIDPVFQSKSNLTPANINTLQQSNHWVRTVTLKELFDEIELQQGQPQQLPTLDLSYYPDERGQYNYNSQNMEADGTLNNPKENWAGIMRRIETNDFEATNIDYIEVWLMDPFVYSKHQGTKHNTGQLYINLGSVSEDIIPDRKRSAENGLPVPNGNYTVDSGKYALTPRGQIINKAFDNDPAARTAQDIGLDGMSDEVERTRLKFYLDGIAAKHGTASLAYKIAEADPSADNYLYPRDPVYDGSNAMVLQRYKNYNGFEGNSTVDKLADGTPKSANTIPDDEDINQDYTVNLNEEYYQYKIEISPDKLRIGENFVTDSIFTDANQIDPGAEPNKITWYQLKIPIRQYEKKVGGIQDFKSIRFMRMYVSGFEDSLVLRFGNLQLVRADWRRYLNTLKFPPRVGPAIDPNDRTELVVSTVNVNENSKRVPIPYVVPPGFSREIDPTQQANVQQNEQSLSIAVCNLGKDDARGAYRPIEYDIRNYKKLKMFVHAESQDPLIQKGDVVAIMRIGTDLENNFYQYEIPLTISPNGNADPAAVWPTENEILIELEEFYRVKLNRQLANSANPNGFYSETLANGHKISIIGLPDLSNVRTILLGVKNPSNGSSDALCAEVWFNELRLVDFANKGGYAATTRMVAKLADFANVAVSGNYQSIGFGGIDKKLNERNITEQIQYDIATNLELGKFFSQKSGITVPMFIGYSENIVNPKFYPLNPDILLRTAINNAETQTERDAIRIAAQDYNSRYSLNFTNVKKNKTGAGESHIYDVSNWNYSFAYQRLFRRSQIIERNDVKTYRTSLAYNFSPKPLSWEPFKKSIKSKKLTLIKDFNVGLKPSNLNFRIEVDRRYAVLKNRDNDNFKSIVPLLYDKTFNIGRIYGAKWNLTKSLSVDYASSANSWVEEPFGALDTREKKDSMWRDFSSLGQLRDFNQTVNANYSLPLRKIKMLDWMTVTTRYTGNYQWQNAPPAAVSLGNTIQNSRTMGVTSNLNFISLYNKVPFLKKVNKPAARKSAARDEEDPDAVNAKKEKDDLSATTKAIFQFLMMLKQAQGTFTFTDGTTLPGFNKTIDYLGQNFKNNAPGLPFVIGGQSENFRKTIARNGFLTQDTNQISRYVNLHGVDINGSATVEPIKGFRINVSFNKRQSLNINSNFKYSEARGTFEDEFYTEVGTFTTSYGSWATMFDKLNKDFSSDAFNQFKNNRFVIAQRLQSRDLGAGGVYEQLYGAQLNDKDTSGYPLGYSAGHPEVLLHSFLAAYTGKNAGNSSLDAFRKIPIPNWRVTYNGLSQLDVFKDIFSNISITHGYSSTLNIGTYQRPQDYGKDSLTIGHDIATQYQYNSGVSIIERLTPLIGIDITTKEGISAKFEYKTDRNLQMNLITRTMVEMRNKEFVIGAGYRASGIRLPIKLDGKNILLRNDLNIRFDFSIRDGVTIVRTIDGNGPGQDSYIPTGGIKTVSIRPSIDYKISDALNFRMFYNRNANNPVTSNSFPSALTDFGVTLRYNLQ